MVTLSLASLLFPILTLAVAIVIGILFNFVPAKTQSRKPLPLIAFAAVAGAVCTILTFLFNSTISNAFSSMAIFQNFATIFSSINVAIIKYNAPLVAIIFLIAALEVGLGSGFGVAFALGKRSAKSPAAQTRIEATAKNTAKTDHPTQPAPAATAFSKTPDVAIEQRLRRDEQSMMELFLYGKVSQITPAVNASKPEGYYYEGIPQLNWDTKHSRQVLEALVRKGYLNAELTDKVIVCQTCGSGNVRLIKTCPECGSLRLQKEALIEHFSCGAVERQSAFETQNGDLLCPKCKNKLQLIGSDYRQLPPRLQMPKLQRPKQ